MSPRLISPSGYGEDDHSPLRMDAIARWPPRRTAGIRPLRAHRGASAPSSTQTRKAPAAARPGPATTTPSRGVRCDGERVAGRAPRAPCVDQATPARVRRGSPLRVPRPGAGVTTHATRGAAHDRAAGRGSCPASTRRPGPRPAAEVIRGRSRRAARWQRVRSGWP